MGNCLEIDLKCHIKKKARHTALAFLIALFTVCGIIPTKFFCVVIMSQLILIVILDSIR